MHTKSGEYIWQQKEKKTVSVRPFLLTSKKFTKVWLNQEKSIMILNQKKKNKSLEKENKKCL